MARCRTCDRPAIRVLIGGDPAEAVQVLRVGGRTYYLTWNCDCYREELVRP